MLASSWLGRGKGRGLDFGWLELRVGLAWASDVLGLGLVWLEALGLGSISFTFYILGRPMALLTRRGEKLQ